jgi:IclR family pca regulon transcriptional regulator
MTGKPGVVRALAAGLRAIEAFQAADRRLTLTEVAGRAGVTRAAARRYLHTLCALGYAKHDGKRFFLMPRVLKLGYAFISATPLPNLAQPLLEQVGAQTGEVVALSVLEGAEVVFLARSTPRRALATLTGVGGRLPAFNSASGRVMLAATTDREIERLMRRAGRSRRSTLKTKTAPPEILREIRRARRLGYAVNDEERELGVRSVAVPVLTPKGSVVAAISLSSRSAAMSLKEMTDEAVPLLQHTSRSLGELL